MKISRGEVNHIALLARMGLTEEEEEKLTEQLSDILENFEILQQVDTEGIPPTAQSITLRNVISEDVTTPSLPAGDVLANAPKKEDDFFRVRAVLDE